MAHELRDLDHEMAVIDDKVTQLFSLVAEGLAGATDAFLAGDVVAARTLIARGSLVDGLYFEIEEMVQRRFALLSPLAQDLRYLLSMLRIVPELERCGDLVEHIAQRAVRGIAADLTPRIRGIVERMGAVSSEMWRASAAAYRERDGEAVDRLRSRDDELDSLHVALTAEIVAAGLALPLAIEMALIGRFYERLGDHAVNVGNRIRYMVSGRLLRQNRAPLVGAPAVDAPAVDAPPRDPRY